MKGEPGVRSVPKRPSRLAIRAPRSPERILATRLAILLALVAIILALFWYDRDGLHDNADGEISFGDVVYFTAVTVSTVGYGDIVPVSPRARLVDTALVTPLRLVIWLIFLGTAYELVLQRWLENWRMSRLQRHLKEHVIICGFGHTGQSAAAEARSRGTPASQILVIDLDEQRLRQATASGYIGLTGDATQEATLADCCLHSASAVLVCLGRDDTATLTVLTVRQLNERVRIVCNVGEQENIKLVRHAGADVVIATSVVGGHLMADSMQSSRIADYVNDLICFDGRVRLSERPARSDEFGRPMRELGPGLMVRLHRHGESIGFWEGDRAIVQPGDLLLEIEANPGDARSALDRSSGVSGDSEPA